MHDWLLKKIDFKWQLAQVKIDLEDTNFILKFLIAEKVTELYISQTNAWGKSCNIYKFEEIELLPSGLKCLKLQMQSGDIIKIVAEHFIFPL